MNNQTEYRTMTQKKSNRTLKEIKAMMGEDDEFFAPDGARSHSGISGSGEGASRRSGEGGTSRRATQLPQWLLLP